MAERSLNKVMLLGRVGRDPEVRYTGSGRAVATFSLATSFTWKDQDGAPQDRTEWHRIVAWGRLGEICGEYLSKGKQVYIEGRIQTRDWEDQDGAKRTTTEIVVGDMILLGGPSQGDSRDRGSDRYADRDRGSDRQGEGTDESPPPREPRGARDQRPPAKGRARTGDRSYEPPPPEDDIPF